MKKSTRSRLVLSALIAGLWPALTVPAPAITRSPALLLSPQPNAAHLESTEPNSTLIAGFFHRPYRFRVRASRYRRGGIARGDCPSPSSFVPLTNPVEIVTQEPAIVRDTQTPAYAIASSRPVLFVNMPELPTTQGGILFIDDADLSVPRHQRQLYKAEFELSGTAGIVGFRLPPDAPLLEGNAYLWRLSIACSANSINNFVKFNGGVIEPVAEATGTSNERLNYYVAQDLWQDLLMFTAQQRYQNPSSMTAKIDWAEFVTGSGLANLADVPIVDIIDLRLAE